jgi:hypothetical protein
LEGHDPEGEDQVEAVQEVVGQAEAVAVDLVVVAVDQVVAVPEDMVEAAMVVPVAETAAVKEEKDRELRKVPVLQKKDHQNAVKKNPVASGKRNIDILS